jgi:hypothetical protein
MSLTLGSITSLANFDTESAIMISVSVMCEMGVGGTSVRSMGSPVVTICCLLQLLERHLVCNLGVNVSLVCTGQRNCWHVVYYCGETRVKAARRAAFGAAAAVAARARGRRALVSDVMFVQSYIKRRRA